MIEQSDGIKNLAVALLKAQAELGAVAENATNPFFKSNYADLGEHIKTIKPVFTKHGLAVTQFVTGSDNEMGVTTMLIHESGEWLRDTATIPLEEEKGNSKAQTAGKAISYLRRYMLAAVANVYSGDDNDGNIVQPKQEKPKQTKPKQNGKERPYSPAILKDQIEVVAKKYRNEQKTCSATDRQVVAAALDTIFEKDTTKRYELCGWLADKASTKEMGAEYINALKTWLGVEHFGDEPSADAVTEAINALPEALKASGQIGLEI